MFWLKYCFCRRLCRRASFGALSSVNPSETLDKYPVGLLNYFNTEFLLCNLVRKMANSSDCSRCLLFVGGDQLAALPQLFEYLTLYDNSDKMNDYYIVGY